jgi:hypothetical protein
VWEFAPLSSGPRYLPTFGSPHGALGVGRIYLDLAQQKARPDFAASARVARALGYLALGREDSARDEARELADQERTPELALLVHEIEAALLVLDPSPGWLAERWPGLSSHLPQFAESRSAAEGVRRRAAFSYTLVARRAGDSSDRYTWVLEREPAPQPLGRLLAADSLARSGRLREALDVSEPLTELLADTLGRPEPAAPFFRSVLHVLRAEWYRKLGNVQDAGAELIWHQNLDEERGWLTGAPQVGEADWALATLGHWRLASLSDEAGETGTPVCHAYAEVVRLWSGGEPRYAARADTARARRAALGCERGGPAGGSRTAGEPREAGTERS